MALLSGLQVYYKLEDLTDSSGAGMTLTNNGVVTFVAGKISNAANFVSTSSQFLSHVDATPFQMGTGSFSMSAWIKFTTNVAGIDLVAYGNPAGGAALGYAIVQSGIHIGFAIGDGTHTAAKDSVTTNNDGVWHFAVFTCDRAGLGSIYIDNGTPDTVSVTTVTGSLNSSTGFGIGGGAGGIHLSDSSIDEVGIWNRILTTGEISTLYNGGTGLTYPFGEGLAAPYPYAFHDETGAGSF